MSYPYANGALPADQAGYYGGRRMHKAVAADLAALSAELVRTGHPAIKMGSDPASGYRDLANQRRLFNLLGWPRAARPGTSNHGLGIAVDLAEPYASPGPNHSAMEAIAGRYGFNCAGAHFISTEYWHWEHPELKQYAGGSATTAAPAFPLAPGSYFGPKAGPMQSVSGYYRNRDDLRRWQQRMRDRGNNLVADGLYGPATRSIALMLQRQIGATQDGLIGPVTWRAAWESPIVR